MMSKQKVFTDLMASNIMKQILSAVEYCHHNKIVHRYNLRIVFKLIRDMKPENVVFDTNDLDGTLKIIDFGRSKVLEPKMNITDKAGSVKKVSCYLNSCIILHLKSC